MIATARTPWRDYPIFTPADVLVRPGADGAPAKGIRTTASAAPTAAELLMLAFGEAGALSPHAVLRRVSYSSGFEVDRPADAAPPPLGLHGAAARSRWQADAYLFLRPGSRTAALSTQGQLGGSQVAARMSYRLDRGGRVPVAAAARLYAPLASRGAEAAAGIDVQPLGDVPFRLSVERRQRLDHAGRSAWSAYAAGGLYREVRGIVAEVYGQAGFVGLGRRDGFVDGAVRIGRRIGGDRGPVLGVAAWGAAQPGVARLDAGPRASWRLPLAGPAVTLAVEGRFRMAGRARPGSGVAVTLAAGL